MPTARHQWTPAEFEALRADIAASTTLVEAATIASARMGVPVTPGAIKEMFRVRALGQPSAMLRPRPTLAERYGDASTERRQMPASADATIETPPPPAVRFAATAVSDGQGDETKRRQLRGSEGELSQRAVRVNDDPQIRRLLDVTKRGPVPFDELCDRLDMSPKRTRELVERARGAGFAFDAAHDHVAFRLPEPTSNIADTGVAPTTGERQRVAIISDTHLGSKYCLRAQLRDFIEYAYAQGVREVLHVGDALDGCYKHGVFELTHSGIDAQTQDLFDTLPRLPGLSYHGVTGNHDDTFADTTGMDPGAFMQSYFRERGRDDLRFYGRRGAYLRLRGATFELWHPRQSGAAYSLSYRLQCHLRDYAVGAKPDILLAGHWHTWVYLEQRGVHALACGTFQGGGSAFSKSIGGAPSIGGTIMSWELTDAGTLRRVAVERSAYYEQEQVRNVLG